MAFQELLDDDIRHEGPGAVRGSRAGAAACAYGAAFALATIASDAEAVPILMEVLDDEGLADMWQQACDALGAIGTSAGAARDRLATLATYPIDEIRQAAELALAAIDRSPS
jgi:hypothetical protein